MGCMLAVWVLLGSLHWGIGLAQTDIQSAVDLAADGELARNGGVVILLMLSREHCGWCELLKREQLLPMLKSGDYRERVLIRELRIDPWVQVRDFAGESMIGARLASRYGVKVTPTLLFLDPVGRELTQRIVGINTPELFGWYLDRTIDDAGEALASPPRSAAPVPLQHGASDAADMAPTHQQWRPGDAKPQAFAGGRNTR